MPAEPIFFDSSSRLLGQSPASDFSLFGAQPTTHIPPAEGQEEGADSPRHGAADPVDGADTVPPSQPVAGAIDPSSFLSVPAPMPQGESRPAAEVAAPRDAIEAPPVQPLASPAAPTPAVRPDQPQPDAGARAEAPVSQVDEGSQIDFAGALAAPVLDIAQATAAPVPAIIDIPLPDVGALTEDLTGAADDLLSGIPAPGALIDIVEDVGAPVDGVVTDLLGSDPEGGIATLVSLVNVADVIDLQDAGASVDPNGPATDPVADMLDSLTADPVLQPIDDDSDSGLGGLLDQGLHDDSGQGLGLGLG